jgi:hypothetical protein
MMKTLLSLFAFWLLAAWASPTLAQATTTGTASGQMKLDSALGAPKTATADTTAATAAAATMVDVCSPAMANMLSDAEFMKAIRGPIGDAIESLDNVNIQFSSPILASGKMSYVTITPNIAEALNSTCVIGYFEIAGTNEAHTEPLNVDHIETIKIPNASDPNQFTLATRIFFRAPSIRDFSNSADLDQFWKFWTRHEAVNLKIAAFNYQNGQRLKPWFGRALPTAISHKKTSIFAAWLFALGFYVIAAVTIAYRADRKQEIFPSSVSGLRLFMRRLSPWYVVGSSGHASLSQLQMLLFTLIVGTLLFYQWLRTGLLQELSTDLLYLIGISTVGAGGSQITSSIKKNLDPEVYKYLQQLGWFTAPMAGAHSAAHPSELLLTNSRFDIYKFQMLLFTFVIASYVIVAGASELGNVQISTTLLTLMGISQGAYMGGQAASDALTPLQDQLRGMQLLQENWIAAKDDNELQTLLNQRFLLATKQAADMFSQIFAREIPPYMQVMPIMVAKSDIDAASAANAANAANTVNVVIAAAP